MNEPTLEELKESLTTARQRIAELETLLIDEKQERKAFTDKLEPRVDRLVDTITSQSAELTQLRADVATLESQREQLNQLYMATAEANRKNVEEVGRLRRAVAQLMEQWENEVGDERCDCRREPENEGHICPYCFAQSVMTSAPPPQGEEVRDSDTLVIDTNDPEVRWIFALMCFQCGPIAHVLQRNGFEIEAKAEAEQSFVMTWLLKKYHEFGKCPDWRAKVDAELNKMEKERKAALPAAPSTSEAKGGGK